MENFTPATISMELVKVDPNLIKSNLFKDISSSTSKSCSFKNSEEKLTAYLRLKPNEDSEDNSCYEIINGVILRIKPPIKSFYSKLESTEFTKPNEYAFNQIFDETYDQQAIFDHCCLPLLRKFFKGENTLLFCYGTTSSGKSFTIRGPPENPGLVPRSLKFIFDSFKDLLKEKPYLKRHRFCDFKILNKAESELELKMKDYIRLDHTNDLSSSSLINDTKNSNYFSIDESMMSNFFQKDLKYCIWISFFEVYNDYIYDLLIERDEKGKSTSLKVVLDEVKNHYVNGLKHVFVSSFDEALEIYYYGVKNLGAHIQETGLNKTSSRSHCVFNITLIKFNENDIKNTIVSNLSLCDLAGQERGKKTQNTRERLKEAGKIHGSLLALSQCLVAIRNNQKKKSKILVPFNQTKLTKIFQPFLSGIGTVSMILNINPSYKLFDETTTALEFSATASDVIINTEEARNKFRESYRRMTQIWLQSSKRWSSFARVNELNCKPSLSTVVGNVIAEEEEEKDLTLEDISLVDQRMNDLKNNDFKKMDPLLLEKYRKQNEFLTEQLEAAQDEMINLDLKIRGEIGREVQKMMEEMTKQYEMEREDMHQEYKETIDQRSKIYYNRYKKEEERLKNEIDVLKERLFKADEDNISLNEQINSLIASSKKIERNKDEKILTLSAQLELVTQELESFQAKVNNISNVLQDFKKSTSSESESMKEMLLTANNKVKEFEIEVKNLIDSLEKNMLIKKENIESLKAKLFQTQKEKNLVEQKFNDILISKMKQAEEDKLKEFELVREQFLSSQKQIELLKNEEIELLKTKINSAFFEVDELKKLLKDAENQLKIQNDQLFQKNQIIASFQKNIDSNKIERKSFKEISCNTSLINTQDKNISTHFETDNQYTLTKPIKLISVSTITETESIKIDQNCQTDLSESLNQSSSSDSEKIKELERQCKQYEARIEFKGKILTELQEDYRKLQEKMKETESQLNKYQSTSVSPSESHLPFLKLNNNVNNSSVSFKSKSAKKFTLEDGQKVNLQEEYLKRFAKVPSVKCDFTKDMKNDEKDDLNPLFQNNESKTRSRKIASNDEAPVSKRKKLPVRSRPMESISPVKDDEKIESSQRQLRSRKKISYH